MACQSVRQSGSLMVRISDADMALFSSFIKMPVHLEKRDQYVGQALLEGLLRKCGFSLAVLNLQLELKRCRGSFMLMSRWKCSTKSRGSLSEAQRVVRGGCWDHVTLYQSILPDRGRKEKLIFKRQAERPQACPSNEARLYELDERRLILWTNYPCKSNHG